MAQGPAGNDLNCVYLKFKFNGTTDGGERAVFKLEENVKRHKKTQVNNEDMNLYDYLSFLIKREFEPYTLPPPEKSKSSPPHTLQVGEELHDTELFGFEVDYEKHMISVLWKPTLSLLFGETEYNKWARWVQHQHSGLYAHLRGTTDLNDSEVEPSLMDLEEMPSLIDSEGDDAHDALASLKSSLLAFEIKSAKAELLKTYKSVLLTARRMRFRRCYMKLAGYNRDQKIEEDNIKLDHWLDEHASGSIPAQLDVVLGKDSAEEGYGTFYDGMGMTYKGMSEMEDEGCSYWWTKDMDYDVSEWGNDGGSSEGLGR
ncbi:Uu.00g096540.m01.CDS01 [Anthostomella pinea]|uniref:Uu.00g096540.m01.CDS01 n=1 Tax=Anthostomella pinea TaxID=933095 RepID=A0AAI8YEY1_9PEZI|nr:Uu.00g096540.m01.CDS01 [Anthostomella pinea]